MNNSSFLFETSWEVCNKVGGIHTVLMTKAASIKKEFNSYILIGPDLAGNASKEFIEDKNVFKLWHTFASNEGIKIRIGHWDIECSPIVILVDFTQYFSNKNEIFTKYWEHYKVDSLTGSWDYIEPFIFGYAAAKVIESFYNFYCSSTDKIVAQFHEWMTGSGVLYLKEHAPQIATVFTTHATVLGRCLAGNNVALYSEMNNFVADRVAQDFNVQSKYSLEKYSALNADGFTTVSEITNTECKQFFGKSVNIITPNGFEGDFVPNKDEYLRLRSISRNKIFNLIETKTGNRPQDDTFLIINSGRYEYKNKGIDVFIDVMNRINQLPKLNKKIIAVIAVPAGHMGESDNKYLTHTLTNPDYDPIMSAINNSSIHNVKEENVNILFIPSYLDGADGVINMSYFDFLTAFDLTIFPSYYEPWGYTPMESMAFGIPSITTTLSGFGLWVKANIDNKHSALTIIDRNDNNEQECVDNIVKRVEEIVNSTEDYKQTLKQESFAIFSQVQWKELVKYYLQVYDLAIEKTKQRSNMYAHKTPMYLTPNVQITWGDKPQWKKFLVKYTLADELKPLYTLASNLWWSWNYDALDLFYKIDYERFLLCDRSPIRLLQSLNDDDVQRLIIDKNFMSSMHKVLQHFNTYIEERKQKTNPLIAYFSMEFGIHDCLQIFSGGLGMLAGDYLKQASDSNKNIVGIGLLYRQGYFKQHITKEGEQQSERVIQSFHSLPCVAVRDKDGEWLKISLDFPGRKVYAKIWRQDVGVTPLYLLDTDIDENSPEDKKITEQLYGGNNEMRLKQEILLGMGGVKLLHLLNLHPTIYHLNEGHSAFCTLQRLLDYIANDNLSYMQALELVRSSTLFTTHTPVPAGHDVFEEDLMRVYFSQVAKNIGLSWDDFMLLGRKSNDDRSVKFSVSVLCISCASNINGVSKIHGRVSRQMFKYLYDGYMPNEINIGYVTNGVHLETWVARQWKNIYDKYFDKDYISDESNERYWHKIYSVPDKEIWQTHTELKHELIEFCKQRLQKEMLLRGENPNLYPQIVKNLSEDKLTIGFARRFATYKRANLLFTNLQRLENIVNSGVQFIFAGKAHPADKQGQELIKNIINISKMSQFVGKIIFIENYDMYVAKHLISGCDIWLNTPTRPLEASGTSGEKAIMNGTINFSVLDGWWTEGYRKDAGWALDEKPLYTDDYSQNIYDAETIYNTLENDIIPTYYKRDESGLPDKWISIIKNTIYEIAPHYTMKRQLDDYFSKYYQPMFTHMTELKKDNMTPLTELALFKQRTRLLWNSMEVVSMSMDDTERKTYTSGDHFKVEIKLNTAGIPSENIGIEMILTHKENGIIQDADKILQLNLISSDGFIATYVLDEIIKMQGVHDFAFRIYPKHHLLQYRMDLPLLKWL